MRDPLHLVATDWTARSTSLQKSGARWVGKGGMMCVGRRPGGLYRLYGSTRLSVATSELGGQTSLQIFWIFSTTRGYYIWKYLVRDLSNGASLGTRGFSIAEKIGKRRGGGLRGDWIGRLCTSCTKDVSLGRDSGDSKVQISALNITVFAASACTAYISLPPDFIACGLQSSAPQ